ncbi:MAG TPA: carboxypeptidase-like regulatory domain-containing protein, partial [Blastocatellia bacterium]|nr:carboxypeptidase-like regulatory domain-containing protein [Blastocatellia bacterium]
DKQDQRAPFNIPSSMMLETDDRGIYRLYGIPEGRYTISVGEDSNQGAIRMGNPGEFYARTYHPDVTDVARATIIEVIPGSEATGIDIKVGRPSKTYSVTGRVIDGQTGRPVSGAVCGYGPLSEDGKRIQGFGSGFRTDSTGKFRMDGLVPGRYAAFANLEGESSSYSEPVIFTIERDDVGGLEIKLIAGSSISGQALIEGTDDPAVLSRISQLQVYASNLTEGVLRAPRREVVRPASDGSFRIGGLPPGKFTIHISNYPVQKGFLLLRVERNGVEMHEPINLAEGENITGLKLVIGYGTSIIRGQVSVEGGPAPPETRFHLSIRRPGDASQTNIGRPIEADERGRFQFDGLVAGEYEIHLISYRMLPEGGRAMTRDRLSKMVTVGNNTETEVTFVVDLSENRRDNEQEFKSQKIENRGL